MSRPRDVSSSGEMLADERLSLSGMVCLAIFQQYSVTDLSDYNSSGRCIPLELSLE